MYFAGAVAVALVAILTIALVRSGKHPTNASRPQAAPASVLQPMTSIPASVFDAVGSKGATPPIGIPGQAPQTKPTVLYVGGDYCPFCAAERWPVIVALSRFGHFSGLTLIRSSATDYAPSTPTFSFYGAEYQSPYLSLQAVEAMGDSPSTPLQKLTAQQQSLLSKYDSPPYVAAQDAGSIPFLLIGQGFLFSGAAYPPTLLGGKGKNWSEIASALPTGKGDATKAIIANANEITAAVCALDGGQPASVCKTSGVESAAATLPKGSTH